MAKFKWSNSFLSLCLLFVVSFTVVRISGNEIWLHASSKMVSGTDSACEAYWVTVNSFLESFSIIHITNKGWIPSPKVITRSSL